MNFQRLAGLFPLGIGLTVLVFLWSMPFGEFGSPPLFFRIFGSIIALFFCFAGFGFLTGKTPLSTLAPSSTDLLRRRLNQLSGKSGDEAMNVGQNYECSNCGAGLDESAEVSPHGDVKCTHCGKWFNIHRAMP